MSDPTPEEKKPVFDVKILMKSGAVGEYKMHELKTKSDSSGNLTSLAWTLADATQIVYIDIKEIAAIECIVIKDDD